MRSYRRSGGNGGGIVALIMLGIWALFFAGFLAFWGLVIYILYQIATGGIKLGG